MILITDTKKEHYIPRSYLRQFSKLGSQNSKKDRFNKFLVYDKWTKKRYNSTVYDCACENYFYDLNNIKNEKYKKIVENYFANDIEGCFSDLIRKFVEICNQRENRYKALISNKREREDFSYYLVIQLLRTRKFRDIQARIMEPIIINRLRCYKAYKENCLHQTFDLDIEKVNINAKKYQLQTLFNNEILNELSGFVASSYWTFQYNETSTPFIISDNPVCWTHHIIGGDSNSRIAPFISPWFEIYFPLSPKIVLYIYRENSIIFKKVGKRYSNRLVTIDKPNIVDIINQFQYIMAYKKIFINPDNSELLEKYCVDGVK